MSLCAGKVFALALFGIVGFVAVTPASLGQAMAGLGALLSGSSLAIAHELPGGLPEETLLSMSSFDNAPVQPVALKIQACDEKDSAELARPIEQRL